MEIGLSIRPEENEPEPVDDQGRPWPRTLWQLVHRLLERCPEVAPLKNWLDEAVESVSATFEENKQAAIQAVREGNQALLDEQNGEIESLKRTILSISRYFEELVAAEREKNRRDELTGLHTLGYLVDRLQTLFALSDIGRWGALVAVDIRNFKWYNDTPGLGHAIGDQVIIAVARKFQSVLRQVDTEEAGRQEDIIVRRAGKAGGADEFLALLLGQQNTKDTHEIIQRFKEAVRTIDLTETVGAEIAQRIMHEHPIEVDVSIVYIRLGNRDEDVATRKKFANRIAMDWSVKADELMYQAKRDRSSVVYRLRIYQAADGTLVEISQDDPDQQ